MAKVLVCVYSETGNTEKMAVKIAETLRNEGLEVDLRKVDETHVDDLPSYDAMIFGSPTYYGSIAWPMKKLLDESIKYHRKLQGKIGGAFSSAANIGGGNETTVLAILNALLIHGMIVQGDARGDHYGPVSIGRPDERALKECEKYGRIMASLIKKLY